MNLLLALSPPVAAKYGLVLAALDEPVQPIKCAWGCTCIPQLVYTAARFSCRHAIRAGWRTLIHVFYAADCRLGSCYYCAQHGTDCDLVAQPLCRIEQRLPLFFLSKAVVARYAVPEDYAQWHYFFELILVHKLM